jgi:nucleoside-diphosphate-sugar epimerase
MVKKVLIAGASGVVGLSAVDAFLEAGDEVIALSRRKPENASTKPYVHLSVDLRDAAASRQALGSLKGVTHVVYTALFEKPGLIGGWVEQDQMDTNLAMLKNLLEPVLAGGALKHVALLQGTKAYGIHLHPMPIPARERAPRDDHKNFYWLQEDYLVAQAKQHRFDYSIFRPQLIIGGAYNVAMNLAPVIGAYAAICKEEGQPFAFPGGVSYVWEAVDARLLANVFVWAADAPAARGQHFNVTNGDVFEWRNLWPALAQTLGVEVGPDTPRALGTWLPAKSAVWERVVAKHGLRKIGIEELCGESHHYADFCFAHGATEPPPPAFVSAIKLRQAGFTQVCDTEDMFCYWLQNFIERGILPKA